MIWPVGSQPDDKDLSQLPYFCAHNERTVITKKWHKNYTFTRINSPNTVAIDRTPHRANIPVGGWHRGRRREEKGWSTLILLCRLVTPQQINTYLCNQRCEVPLGKTRPGSVIHIHLHRALFNLKRIAIHIQLTRSVGTVQYTITMM